MNITSKMSVLNGEITIPGSKSHTIRAVLLAAMSEGISCIHNPLESFDCQSAMTVASSFGCETRMESGLWTVHGLGNNLKVPENYVDCNNSGSTAYFACSMAALIDGYTFITGDDQIRRRPIQNVLDAINTLGGKAFTSRPGVNASPAIIRGKMTGGTVHFRKSLSQFVSSIMLSAPLSMGDTEIINEEPIEKPYLQITIDWMRRYGIELAYNSGDYRHFKIKGRQAYTATDSIIPGDWSGVAFPLVAALITNSEITILGVDFNDSQGDKAVIDYLISMGADIKKDIERGRLLVKGGNTLKGGLEIDLSDIPDALPILTIAAAFAKGSTTFKGLGHVRLKETDRVAVMAEELGKIGAEIVVGPDYMIVNGGRDMTGSYIKSHGDHRVAMAMTVCGLACKGEMIVEGGECAAVSFPSFFKVMRALGANISEQ